MGIRSIKSLLRATPRLGRCDRRERRVRTAGVGVVASSTSSYSEICGKSDCNLQFWFLKRCRVKLYLFKATTDCSAFRQSKCWYWLEFPCEGMVYAEPVPVELPVCYPDMPLVTKTGRGALAIWNEVCFQVVRFERFAANAFNLG